MTGDARWWLGCDFGGRSAPNLLWPRKGNEDTDLPTTIVSSACCSPGTRAVHTGFRFWIGHKRPTVLGCAAPSPYSLATLLWWSWVLPADIARGNCQISIRPRCSAQSPHDVSQLSYTAYRHVPCLGQCLNNSASPVSSNGPIPEVAPTRPRCDGFSFAVYRNVCSSRLVRTGW